MAQIRINITFIWNNGIEKEAIYLDAVSTKDNLETEATFYYNLLDENYTILANGFINIVGDDYLLWLSNNFSTNWVMNWIAKQLNLTPTPIK